MTQDEIVKLAREAHQELVTLDYPGHTGQLNPWTMRLLERFAALVRADEREAICPMVYGMCGSDNDAERIVRAIRARGQA